MPDPVFLTDGAGALLNRLRKNARHRGRAARRGGFGAYRLYDADLPEYAAAIDVYGDHAHVQEYAAPANVDAERAARRFEDVLAAAAAALDIPRGHVVAKVRRRQSGGGQYQRIDDRGSEFEVREGPARLLVNLHDYLDTGLFPDHRLTRAALRAEARGARFLNLFCYTAAVTVHVGLGGAASTLSIDKSNAYLAWAERNLSRNGLLPPRHRLERADVVAWLRAAREERFDLIFLDPPTHSRSKSMREDLDTQRDHAEWIVLAATLLAPEGTLVFSSNARGFQLDREALAAFDVRDWTAATTPPEFAGARPPHRCYRIRLAPER